VPNVNRLPVSMRMATAPGELWEKIMGWPAEPTTGPRAPTLPRRHSSPRSLSKMKLLTQ
jgi:hypothetical protein